MHTRGVASGRSPRGGNADPYFCEWGAVVGDRVRRLRRDANLTLHELSLLVRRPEGGRHSAGYFSRLERGAASAPLHTYLAIADALEVDAALLLGPDPVTVEASGAELMLLRCLRGLDIAPHEAMLRLVGEADSG